MILSDTIFKAYDIRGIYPTEIDELGIAQITKAIYSFFVKKIGKDTLVVALGRDMRLSSPVLFASVLRTLQEMGAHVVDLGLVSTPSFYFAVSHYVYDCGIQITASHNPKDYNGMKFVINTPKGLIKIGKLTGMEEIKQLALSGTIDYPKKNGSVVKKEHVLQDEVTNALTLFNNPEIDTFKIVADPANAMGATYLDTLAQMVPMDLVRMNFDLDGNFPSHQPDPLDFENLKDLQDRVLSEKADFGLAPDGDGDRLFFVDEKGQVVPATIITAIIAKELLMTHPKEKILFDIRYILTPQSVIREYGGATEVTKVGHAYITQLMHESGGIFAGESSGHYFFNATGNAESQVAVIICMLSVLTKEHHTLSELVAKYRRSYESGEINFTVENAAQIMEKAKDSYKDGQLSELDGVAIAYPSWRFSLRTSNTEPLLRLNVEAKDFAIMEEKKKELVGFISDNKQ